MPDVTVGNHMYKYNEKSFGKNRGITIAQTGSKGLYTYTLRPDPHDDPKYNNKNQSGQARFYLSLATAIGQTWEQTNAAPRADSVVTVQGIDYTLGER